MKKANIAIVGATGMVGRTFLKVLEEMDFSINHLYLFASGRSAGQSVMFRGHAYTVEELSADVFDRDIDVALFSAGGSISKEYAPIAAQKGVVVVDNSSAWRMDENVPLVVPEVNPEDIKKHKGIIANPNCSTIQAVVALKPLLDKYGIKRVVYSTYQAVSGAGMQGVMDLERSLKGEAPQKFPYPIANNCIPHIDVFLDNGYTKEEMKMVEETRKIMHVPNLPVTATAVRVPVTNCHSESINVELSSPFELEDVVRLLESAPGVVVQNDGAALQYPLATTASGHDEVYVGRIRRDESIENGLNLWVVADNVRKGAASNAVQIAKLLLSE